MSQNEMSVTAALAFIMSTYSESPESCETIVVRNAPKGSKSASKIGSSKNRSAPIEQSDEINMQGAQASKNTAPGPKSEPLPAKGQIGPEEFLKSLSNCGKRPNNKGVLVFQGAKEQRDDEMRLVASYCGWDSRQLHGWNLENARRTAKLAIKPVTGASYKRGMSATMAGYIAGLPDNQQKLVQDLLAREQLAAKAIVDHQNTIANTSPTNPAHILAKGLLGVEEERLAHIRKDLVAQGVFF